MGKIYYSSEALAQKQALCTYFDTIVASLNEINKVNVSEDWKCTEADNVNAKLVELQSKIGTIKTAITSYEDFFDVANSSYEGLSGDIEDAITTYING